MSHVGQSEKLGGQRQKLNDMEMSDQDGFFFHDGYRRNEEVRVKRSYRMDSNILK